jgi:regulator of replication initiation timing
MSISNDLNYLHSFLNEIESKIYNLNGEIENIKGHIKELEEFEQKKRAEKETLTQELECLIKQIREKEELKQKEQYDLEVLYRRNTDSLKCSCYSQEYDIPVSAKRIIPVDDGGKPIKELANGKWSR